MERKFSVTSYIINQRGPHLGLIYCLFEQLRITLRNIDERQSSSKIDRSLGSFKLHEIWKTCWGWNEEAAIKISAPNHYV